MHPAATTLPPFSAASRRVAMESCLAASMNPQVLTTVTSAGASPSTSSQPSADRRPASSSESTSLRAQPKVTSETVRRDDMASKRVGELRVMRVAAVRTHGIRVRDRGRYIGGADRHLLHYIDLLRFFQGGRSDGCWHVCGPCTVRARPCCKRVDDGPWRGPSPTRAVYRQSLKPSGPTLTSLVSPRSPALPTSSPSTDTV